MGLFPKAVPAGDREACAWFLLMVMPHGAEGMGVGPGEACQ